MRIRGYRLIDIINPYKWYLFVLGKLLAKYITFNFCEQVVYRSLQCPDCLQAGKCIHCGCHIPEKFLTPPDSCDQENWGPMLSEEEWKNFKQGMGIELHILRK